MSDQENESFVPNPAFAKYDTMTVTELVKSFGDAKANKEEADDAAKAATAIYDFLRLVKIPAVFEEQEIKILKVDGVGRCQLAGDIYCSVLAGHKEDAFTFLRDTGRGDLIKEEVNASTLKVVLKGMVAKGEPIPEEIFRVVPFTRASLVKA